MRDLDFTVSPEVKQIGVHVMAARLVGLQNRSSLPEFNRYKSQLAYRLRAERDPSFIKTDEVLEGFRELHSRIGLSRQAQPAASEALLRLLRRKGVIHGQFASGHLQLRLDRNTSGTRRARCRSF